MSFLSTLAGWFVPQPLQERTPYDYPPLSEQLAAIRSGQAGYRPWRAAGVQEALGVPAILGAVSLISNTVGSLTLEAHRRGVQLGPDEVPRLIVRPNPFTTPRVFFRDTAFYLATRGEAWWWVAARDVRDDTPLSLFPVPPWEVTIEENSNDRLKPKIQWLGRTIPNQDMRHITYLPGSGGRGVGPLQLAGAAVSVTVEADAWAANFFSGSMPSIIGSTEQEMTEEELAMMDRQWVEKPNNLPRWLTQGLTMSEPPYNPEKGQLTETRLHQVGEVARMFDMPGSLLEFNMPGSSLRYQNDETVWSDFQRRCLRPHYLQPIEQEIEDLLPRSTSTQFNVDELLKASIKTRFEVYEKAVTVFGPEDGAEYARTREGLSAGSSDFRPVPPSPPQAIPERLPFERSMTELRCEKCGKKAGMYSGHVETLCSRCGALVAA